MEQTIFIKPRDWKDAKSLIKFLELEFTLKGDQTSVKVLKSADIDKMFSVLPLDLGLLRLLIARRKQIFYNGNKSEYTACKVRTWVRDISKWTPELCDALDDSLILGALRVLGLEFMLRICRKEVMHNVMQVVNKLRKEYRDYRGGIPMDWWEANHWCAYVRYETCILEVLRRTDLTPDERIEFASCLEINERSSPEMLGETFNVLGFNDEDVATILYKLVANSYNLGAATKQRFEREEKARRRAYGIAHKGVH